MNIYILARRHATPFERQSALWWRSSGLPSHSRLPSGSLCLGGQGTHLTPPLPLCPESAPCRERSPPSGAALWLIPLRPFWGAHFPTVDLAGGLTKSTRCIVSGSLHSSVWLHTSVWLQSPRFYGVHQTVVSSTSTASVLQQELSSFLLKGAIEEVPQSDLEQGLFQLLFPCAKERWRFTTHSRSASSEPLPLQREVQDVDVEDYYVSDLSWRLVCHCRPERCLFPHSGRPAA